MPAGWQIGENDDNANLSYAVGTGSGNGGNVYSFGSAGSTDRALGSLTSGSLQPAYYGALFTNALGTTINALTVSYTGEQWRRGDTRADGLSFQYRLTSGAIDAGTWTTVDALAFASPSTSTTVGALDGNAVGNRQAISATIGGLSIAAGSIFAIRWVDLDAAGSDDGLAIDDVSVLVAPIAAVPEPASWALMIAGFGLVGGVLRRRRATIAFA